MLLIWSGRIFVNEPRITPEQYKMFFGRYEFGISFAAANQILAANQKNDYSEIVPADELNDDAKTQIKDAARYGCTSGMVEYAGQTLNWNWKPEFKDENGDKILPEDVPVELMDEVLCYMLDHECHCGIID